MKVELGKNDSYLKLEVGDVISKENCMSCMIIEYADGEYPYQLLDLKSARVIAEFKSLDYILEDVIMKLKDKTIIKGRDLVLSRIK